MGHEREYTVSKKKVQISFFNLKILKISKNRFSSIFRSYFFLYKPGLNALFGIKNIFENVLR